MSRREREPIAAGIVLLFLATAIVIAGLLAFWGVR
jgi:hypothetical protein